MAQTFFYNQPFELECGAVLPSLSIAYDTFGEMNAERSNIIWVCHALTANSDVADWWPHTVEEGCFLDPKKYFTVCANFLGSHYGTTGPLSINPTTGEEWYGDFPLVTVRDMVRAHQLLAKHLGISRVKLLIGSSIGGFQCLEWCVMQPDFAEHAAFIATTPRTKPWASAFNESQRMAIECDPTFGERKAEAGLNGMATARSIALLSYRGGMAYDKTQEDATPDEVSFERRVLSYQRYQGEKLRRRFNAYSYYRLSQAVDSHNLARGRGSLEEVLKQIKAKSLVVAITSDILFPPSDHKVLIENIPSVEYHLIDSDFGHDGFLVEHEQLNRIILDFLNK
ncbi:MAG: homoserine O-acetyltransferase [Alistipes sp.]|nr:homoserine O-acetyltransferase [Alistipes sp.]MBQ6580892.1 homoserine O-acetyltransferase [Alistipes sp.]